VNLSDVSIRRPVFAAMLVLGLVVLGFVSLGRLEMQMDPDLEFPFCYVLTELRGASPETVEREVTDVLEEHINSIAGIRTLRSVSSQGLSRVHVEFTLNYDVDIKAQEVRDKVALARPFLPPDVEDPVVQKFDLNAISMLTIVLGGSVSLRDLSDLAEHEVKERLERLPGVGGVNVLGARQREVRIWLDPLRRRAAASRATSGSGPSPPRARRGASRTSAPSSWPSGPGGSCGCATWRSSRTAWPRRAASPA
jgi:HAE1 family hydrophobic/amphiphilic exporter-1